MNLQLKTLEISPNQLNYQNFVKRSALEGDIKNVIRESVVVKADGKIKIIYLDLDQVGLDCQEIVEAVKRIKYQTNERTGGLKTTSRIFGFAPRITLRKDFCSATSLANEFPKEHQVICEYAEKITNTYLQIDPFTYKRHEEMINKTLPEWRIKRSLFTSGIVNKNNPLKYHFDSGNFKDVYSCMLGFKKDIGGGYLAIPEYNLAMEIKNNSLLIFDGQNILHGVTPIHYLSKDAYRYTLVYYSLKQMWNCLPLDQELARIKNVKTQREYKRLQSREAEAFKNVR